VSHDIGGAAAPGSTEARLDELTDLFRRRLLDDRDKRRMVDEAQERARAAEVGPFRQFLHPVVVGLALVVDRLDSHEGPDAEFAASVRDELLDVLDRHGVGTVAATGQVDLTRHEVVGVEGEAAPDGSMEVARVVRRGFQHADWVFRSAQVVATAPNDGTGS